MKRKKYTVYLGDEEYEICNTYATSNMRNLSSFLRFAGIAEAKKHMKEKAVYKRLEALEKKVFEDRE